MGFAPSQAFTIPFLVLLKAIELVSDNANEINTTIMNLVLETCKDMICSNEALKKQIIDQATQFMSSPAQRTADIVPSIQLLTAQLLALKSLPED